MDSVLERSTQIPRAVCYGLKKELGRWGRDKKGKKEEKRRRRIKEICYLQERERARSEEMEKTLESIAAKTLLLLYCSFSMSKGP